LICQILHVYNQLNCLRIRDGEENQKESKSSSHNEIFFELIKQIKNLKQSELVWFLTSGKKISLPHLQILDSCDDGEKFLSCISRFELIGISIIVSYVKEFYEEKILEEISKRINFDEKDLFTCNIVDLISAATSFQFTNATEKKFSIWKALSKRFFELSCLCIEKKFLKKNVVINLDLTTLTKSIESYEGKDFRKIYLVLSILQSRGIIIRKPKFIERLILLITGVDYCDDKNDNEDYQDFFDLSSFFLLTYGFDSRIWNHIQILVCLKKSNDHLLELKFLNLCYLMNVMQSSRENETHMFDSPCCSEQLNKNKS
jgi:hypothetical protein